MVKLSKGTELVQWIDKDSDGYFTVQLAMDGILSVPFSYHCSQVIGWDEDRLAAFWERQSRSLIDRYGDARQEKRDEHIEAADLAALAAP